MAVAVPLEQDPPATVRNPVLLEQTVFVIGVVTVAVILLLIIALPLGTLLAKSFTDGGGAFVGLANYRTYFSTPALVQSLWNSIWVSALTTAIVIPLAFGYAYAITRTALALKPLFVAVALLPLFTPSLL